MSKYTELLNATQKQPIPGREAEMVKNRAGGYTFQIHHNAQLLRFLILGSDSATYYASAQEMTLENAQVVREYSSAHPRDCANIIRDVSINGRAMRNENAIFALAVMAEHSTPEARKEAFAIVNDVCRTGSQFMQFNRFLKELGGKSNRSSRTMIHNWYNSFSEDNLAYQTLKYRNRYGWKHQDLINLGHVKPKTEGIKRVMSYIMAGEVDPDAPKLIEAWAQMLTADNEKTVIHLIDKYDLTWEFVPSQWLESKEVWNALLTKLPYTALLRNLGQLTSKGVIKVGSSQANYVAMKFDDVDSLRKARVHPFSILLAQRVYQQGKGVRGSLRWNPVPLVVDALEGAFYGAFENVEPTGKSFYFGIDASGSTGALISDHIPMMVSEAEAVMAMVSARVERNSYTEAFVNGQALGVNITRRDSLDDAMRKIYKVTTGRTDLAAPMKHARDFDMDIDCFVIMTDNETWAGRHHPIKELANYREWKGDPNVKMITAAFTSTGYSIADPEDPNNMDIVGMDTNTPKLISDFAAGLW